MNPAVSRWPIAPLRRLAVLKAGSGFPIESQGLQTEEYPFYKVSSLGGADHDGTIRDVYDTVSRETAALLGASVVSAGSLVMAKIGAALNLGRIRVLSRDSCIDNNMLALTPRTGVHPRFLFYALHGLQMDLLVNPGAVPSLSERAFRSYHLPRPTLHTQSAVADFLDRETAKIDALIEKQLSLLATIGERVDCTITDAVTGRGTERGRKSANLPWLSTVPEHWGIERVGYHFDVMLGKMLDAGREARSGDASVPYLRAANIQPEGVVLEDLNHMPFTPDELRRLSLRRGDLLVVEGGSVGTSWLLQDDMPGVSFQKTLNRVRSRGRASTHFLHYVLRWLKGAGVIDLICDGSTIAHLTAEKLRGLRVPVPPAEEQATIAHELDQVVADSARLIERVHLSIALTEERRAALISAAVTGQLDIPAGKVA
ncbi:MAG: restriction endonuclease subunit S [Propionibacteriaceae bacterium]